MCTADFSDNPIQCIHVSAWLSPCLDSSCQANPPAIQDACGAVCTIVDRCTSFMVNTLVLVYAIAQRRDGSCCRAADTWTWNILIIDVMHAAAVSNAIRLCLPGPRASTNLFSRVQFGKELLCNTNTHCSCLTEASCGPTLRRLRATQPFLG